MPRTRSYDSTASRPPEHATVPVTVPSVFMAEPPRVPQTGGQRMSTERYLQEFSWEQTMSMYDSIPFAGLMSHQILAHQLDGHTYGTRTTPEEMTGEWVQPTRLWTVASLVRGLAHGRRRAKAATSQARAAGLSIRESGLAGEAPPHHGRRRRSQGMDRHKYEQVRVRVVTVSRNTARSRLVRPGPAAATIAVVSVAPVRRRARSPCVPR